MRSSISDRITRSLTLRQCCHELKKEACYEYLNAPQGENIRDRRRVGVLPRAGLSITAHRTTDNPSPWKRRDALRRRAPLQPFKVLPPDCFRFPYSEFNLHLQSGFLSRAICQNYFIFFNIILLKKNNVSSGCKKIFNVSLLDRYIIYIYYKHAILIVFFSIILIIKLLYIFNFYNLNYIFNNNLYLILFNIIIVSERN